ncbi:hypothetical protein MARPO_0107s0049 [Marchantia polymorpha]|uniref:Uncharacterized protein n=1 Tax=Marchantia polymorpha TaxID=3197 RepID=A0A2R6WD69_MARPO|nr:hypothetical protein MARPO_0107s0049 [Marchantia polymorpha]|eukprot:PTQ31782.1 hypothetical protein MARPO_0107s0049 [Marchantia polymorpha]
MSSRGPVCLPAYDNDKFHANLMKTQFGQPADGPVFYFCRRRENSRGRCYQKANIVECYLGWSCGGRARFGDKEGIGGIRGDRLQASRMEELRSVVRNNNLPLGGVGWCRACRALTGKSESSRSYNDSKLTEAFMLIRLHSRRTDIVHGSGRIIPV